MSTEPSHVVSFVGVAFSATFVVSILWVIWTLGEVTVAWQVMGSAALLATVCFIAAAIVGQLDE